MYFIKKLTNAWQLNTSHAYYYLCVYCIIGCKENNFVLYILRYRLILLPY